MSSSPLAHFEGDWDPVDRERVEAALAKAELNGLPEANNGPGAVWVVIRKVLDNGSVYYLASRKRVSDILRARNADELVRRIQEYIAEG